VSGPPGIEQINMPSVNFAWIIEATGATVTSTHHRETIRPRANESSVTISGPL
ncbi:uncharacterized protein METZ01_LOCUS242911, partial [marine metagenome]